MRQIILPAVAPPVLSALTVAVGQSVRVTVMSELLSTTTGLGAQVQQARTNLETADVFALSVVMTEGVAIQNPAGGHGVYVDANAMFPHIPYYEFPGHTLCVELYKEAGIRTCDIGSFMLGNDPEIGE